jgi:Anti-sigma factor NepR
MMNLNLAIQHQQTIPAIHSARWSIDRRIRAFVNGQSHGEDVLDALYGDVADEDIPDRLSALLKR